MCWTGPPGPQGHPSQQLVFGTNLESIEDLDALFPKLIESMQKDLAEGRIHGYGGEVLRSI